MQNVTQKNVYVNSIVIQNSKDDYFEEHKTIFNIKLMEKCKKLTSINCE